MYLPNKIKNSIDNLFKAKFLVLENNYLPFYKEYANCKPFFNNQINYSMLGLLLIYWIGKYFYKLAEEYHKNQWGYAILGIAIYYGGMMGFGFIIGIIAEIVSSGALDDVNDTLLGAMLIPFGFLSCFLLYKFLQKSWKKNIPNSEDMIKDFGEVEEVEH